MVGDSLRKIIGILLIGILLALNLGPVLGDTVNVDFSGITKPSSTHIAYYGMGSTTTAWGAFDLLSQEHDTNFNCEYADISSSNGTNGYYGTTGLNQISYQRYEFNISKIATDNNFSTSDITKIEVYVEGWGDYLATYLLKGALYKDSNTTWITTSNSDINSTWSIWQHSSNADSTLKVGIISNIADYIGASGYLKFAVRGPPDTVGNPGDNPYVRVDYVYLSITYNVPITAPIITSPAPGSSSSTASVSIQWDPSTGGVVGAPYTYDLQVDDNSSFPSPTVNEAAYALTSYTAVLSNGTWYARTRGYDSNATPVVSAWSVTVPFAVNVVPPSSGGGGAPIVIIPEDTNLSTVTIDAGQDNLAGWKFLENPTIRLLFYLFLVLLVFIGLVKNRVDLALVSAGLIFFSWITRLGDRLGFQGLSFQAKTLSIVDFQLGNAEWTIPVWMMFVGYVVFAGIVIEWLWPYMHRRRMDRRTKDVAWRYAVGTLGVCIFLYYSGFRIG